MYQVKNRRYKPLITEDGPDLLCLKWLMIIILILGMVLLCYAAYVAGFKGSVDDQTSGKPDLNGGNQDENHEAGPDEEVGKQMLGTKDQLIKPVEPVNQGTDDEVKVNEHNETQPSFEDGDSNPERLQKMRDKVKVIKNYETQPKFEDDDTSRENLEKMRDKVKVIKHNETEPGFVDDDTNPESHEKMFDKVKIMNHNETQSRFENDETSPDRLEKIHDKMKVINDNETQPRSVDYDTNPDSLEKMRENINKRINKVVSQIRGGAGDVKTFQFFLLLLLRARKHLENRKRVVESGGLGRKEEEGDMIKTLEHPRIHHILEKLTTSPKALDIYDFSQPLIWDFRCVFMELGILPEPKICINSLEFKDKSISVLSSRFKVKENRMLRYFMDILKSNPDLQAVDLGSYIGKYSLTAAALGRPVLAVEPNVRNIRPFHRSVILNKFQNLVTLVTNPLSFTHKLVQLIYDRSGNPAHTKTVDITKSMLNYDIIDPNDVARTVTLNDLQSAVATNKTILIMDLNGNETGMFSAAAYFFYKVHVRYVLMPWRYKNDPQGYDFISEFFRRRKFVPHMSPHGRALRVRSLKRNKNIIVWIKS